MPRAKAPDRPTWEHVDKMTERKGWFQDQLFCVEGVLGGRWPWWAYCLATRTIGHPKENPIPQIEFTPIGGPAQQSPYHARLTAGGATEDMLAYLGTRSQAAAHVRDVFERAMRPASGHLLDMVEWWLWAFGSSHVNERPRIPEESAIVLYHELQLERLIAHPGDWGEWIARDAISRWHRERSAWFATPLSVTHCMVEMLFHDCDGDSRIKTVCEPCVGTGAMILPASNYSLRIWCQDIDPLMVALTEFAAWLFVPWLVWPGEGVIHEFARSEAPVELPALSAGDELQKAVGQVDLFGDPIVPKKHGARK